MRVHWALSRARATHILLRIWNVNSCCGESRIGWESGSITIISLSESSLFFSSLYLSDPVTDCMLSYHGGLCSFSPVWHISCLLAQPPLTRSAPPSLWPLPGPMNQNPLGPLAADIHGDPYHFFLFFFFTEHIHTPHQQMAQHLGRGKRPWDSCSGCQKSLTSSGKHSLIGN